MVNGSELPNKRHNRNIGKAATMPAKLASGGYSAVKLAKELKSVVAMSIGVGAMTWWILVSVQFVLERAIVGGNQRRIVVLKPSFRIPACKGPTHDFQAFVDHFPIGEYKDGNCPLGRGCKHCTRLTR